MAKEQKYPCFRSLSFQQIQDRMEAIQKSVVSAHWSNVISTVTFIGFWFKNPANLGFTAVFLTKGQKTFVEHVDSGGFPVGLSETQFFPLPKTR